MPLTMWEYSMACVELSAGSGKCNGLYPPYYNSIVISLDAGFSCKLTSKVQGLDDSSASDVVRANILDGRFS